MNTATATTLDTAFVWHLPVIFDHDPIGSHSGRHVGEEIEWRAFRCHQRQGKVCGGKLVGWNDTVILQAEKRLGMLDRFIEDGSLV